MAFSLSLGLNKLKRAMQKGNIRVQTENIFPIIKKFLYSDHDIFIRELVSNAVDATQKLKTLSSIERELRAATRPETLKDTTPGAPSKQSYAAMARNNSDNEWQTVTRGRPNRIPTAAAANKNRPTTLGTRERELHLKFGSSEKASELTSKAGAKLMDVIIHSINSLSDEEKALVKANPITAAKWSARGILIITCTSKLNEDTMSALKAALAPFGSDNDDDITVMNKPPTTLLKFAAVSTVNPDGSETSPEELYRDIMVHPKWQGVKVVEGPKFISRRGTAVGLSAVVLVGVEDDHNGSVGKRLLNTTVPFNCGPRRCQQWIVAKGARQCLTCMRWGHSTFYCRSQTATCARCGANHTTSAHAGQCIACKDNLPCHPHCVNCNDHHTATDPVCPFYKARFDDAAIRALQIQHHERRAQEAAGRVAAQ